jgi:hypothetical protein
MLLTDDGVAWTSAHNNLWIHGGGLLQRAIPGTPIPLHAKIRRGHAHDAPETLPGHLPRP